MADIAKATLLTLNRHSEVIAHALGIFPVQCPRIAMTPSVAKLQQMLTTASSS